MRPRLRSRPRSRCGQLATVSAAGSKRRPRPRWVVISVGLARVVAELAAQPAEVHVDGLGVGVERRLPHVGHQLAAGDDVARARHQGVQELELLAGEPDLAVATPHLSRGGVESYVLHSQHAVKRRDRPPRGWSLWVNCGELVWSTSSDGALRQRRRTATGSTRPKPRTGRAGSRRSSHSSSGSRSAVFWSTISRLRRATWVSRAAMLTGGPKMSPSRWTTGPLARPRRTSGIFGSRPMTLMIPSAIADRLLGACW